MDAVRTDSEHPHKSAGGASAGGFYRFLDRHLALLLSALAVLVYLYQFTAYGWNPLRWDLLYTSGFSVLLFAIFLSHGLYQRFAAALERIRLRGGISTEELDRILRSINSKKSLSTIAGAVIVALLMLAATLQGKPAPYNLGWLEFLLALLAGGAAAGCVIGRMILYGILGAVIADQHVALQLNPASPDGAAGMKPLGDFYFFQALLMAIPAVFLAVWIYLIPLDAQFNYRFWVNPYVGLLFLAILLEMAVFAVPMLSMHGQMQRAREQHLADADASIKKIAELQQRLTDSTSDTERESLRKQIQALNDAYLAIETMPTWPIDRQIRVRFTLGNAALVIGLIGQLGSGSSVWAHIADTVNKVFGS